MVAKPPSPFDRVRPWSASSGLSRPFQVVRMVYRRLVLSRQRDWVVIVPRHSGESVARKVSVRVLTVRFFLVRPFVLCSASRSMCPLGTWARRCDRTTFKRQVTACQQRGARSAVVEKHSGSSLAQQSSTGKICGLPPFHRWPPGVAPHRPVESGTW